MSLNVLSVLIYLADIMQNIAFLFGAAAFILTVIVLLVMAISAASSQSSYRDDEEDVARKKVHRSRVFKAPFFLIIPFIFALLASIIPSQGTVYLIAASEVAEEGYKSEIGNKLTTVINEKLEGYLSNLSVENLTSDVNASSLTDDQKRAIATKLGLEIK